MTDRIKFRQRVSRWLDGDLSADQAQLLEQELESSQALRQEFIQFVSVHAELCNLWGGWDEVMSVRNGDAILSLDKETEDLDASTPNPLVVNPVATIWANGINWLPVLLLLFAATFIFWQIRGRPTTWTQVVQSENTQDVLLNSVEPIDSNCLWYVESESRANAGSYRSGDVLRVTKGKLTLIYTHGTKVVLHAPAAYQLISKMKARMIIGRLTATVSEAGKGFSVITPQATLIDLGTEFSVEVENDGATDFVVFNGQVDVDFHDNASGQRSLKRLRMGEAVRLDASGTQSRIVSINGLTYSELASVPRRPPVITEITDNIERSSVLSYYEIISGGLDEDALAYVDRIAHEYNGITDAGMPEHLIGADYVKMFNSDKINTDIVIEVTVSQPAKLYVFLDNRLEPPAWLTGAFRDTGQDIGVDVGPFKSTGPNWHNKGPTGSGPGESVDNQLSIWVKEVTTPGMVRLGPTDTTAGSGDSNMYGIAATPLP